MKNRRILFVCGGNTCRSPMAGALAGHMVQGLEAETAGVDPGEELTTYAATVISERTGSTGDDHQPLALTDVDPGSYEAVVAMDSVVARDVILWLPPNLPMYVWDVDDPFGKDLDDYRRTADAIEGLIAATFSTHSSSVQYPDARQDDQLAQLDAYLSHSRTRVSQVAPSHRNGIAATASRRFEDLLKNLLADRLAQSDTTLEKVLAEIRFTGAVADARKLPSGVVVNALSCLSKRDEKLQIALKMGVGETLQQFVTTRNTQIHDTESAAIIAGTTKLLELVDSALSVPEFRSLLAAAIASTDS